MKRATFRPAIIRIKPLKLSDLWIWDCLFVVGGEGTLEIGYQFNQKGIPVIGIPKTIDNDLEKTDYTFWLSNRCPSGL